MMRSSSEQIARRSHVHRRCHHIVFPATIVRCGSAGVVIGGEGMRARNQAEQATLETPRDRLFIADELKRSTPSIVRFGRIIFDIRKAALCEGKSLNTRCGAKNGPRKYFLNAVN